MSLKSSRVGSNRLREVLASGRSARTSLFSGKGLSGETFRFSIIAPKRWLKDSSKRNRARRRCREAFKELPKPAINLVVTVKPEVLDVAFSKLREEAAALLRCYSTEL